jgi:hypothetical protein
MKIEVFFGLVLQWVLLGQIECKRTLQPDAFFKWLRWSCTSSNVTVTNANCRVRSLSRSAQNVSGSYEIKQPIDEIFVSFGSKWKFN